MALAPSKELVVHAQRNGYAVPAINVQGANYDNIRAICEAAEENGSPMIIASYVETLHYHGMEWFAQVSKYLADKVKIPVAIHLDHGNTFEICMKAIRSGFTSVMLDGSTEPIQDNIKHTNEVINAARAVGVSVEAEVGELARLDAQGNQGKNKNLASVKDVKEFLSGCEPDLLAVGIGNAHGFYNGKPDIRLDILKEIRAITDIPLVLHGATDIPVEDVKEAIDIGITKINFGTLVRYKLMEYYKEGIETLDHKGHIWKVSMYAEEKLKGDIKDIIMLSRSNNRY